MTQLETLLKKLMKRIIIIGTSGCGKTTLGIRLSKILQLPAIDLDDYHWLPNWQERDDKEFSQIVSNIIKQKSWIISGNYSQVRDLIWHKSDTIIWLDYSLIRCFWQAFYRTCHRIILNEPCCNGNYENIRMIFFSKYSILLWVLTSYKTRKITYNACFNNQMHNKIYLRFNNPRETNYWLNNLQKKYKI